MKPREFELVQEPADARQVATRVYVVQEDVRPPVDLHEDEMVMTFPHLVVREMIAVVAASLAIVLIALTFDAPLEELADPQRTPNPAKAPWYFLGLQELLHYYPPVVSGVILPAAVVVALIFVPYFDINLSREPVRGSVGAKRVATVAMVLGLSVIFYFTGAHPVWALIAPTVAIGGLMVVAADPNPHGGLASWLSMRSLSFWIFVWFLTAVVVLTIIGIFFRGPGWSFTIPWADGIYY